MHSILYRYTGIITTRFCNIQDSTGAPFLLGASFPMGRVVVSAIRRSHSTRMKVNFEVQVMISTNIHLQISLDTTDFRLKQITVSFDLTWQGSIQKLVVTGCEMIVIHYFAL